MLTPLCFSCSTVKSWGCFPEATVPRKLALLTAASYKCCKACSISSSLAPMKKLSSSPTIPRLPLYGSCYFSKCLVNVYSMAVLGLCSTTNFWYNILIIFVTIFGWLVYFMFMQTLDLLSELCGSHGYKVLRLDGSTPSHRRQSLVDQFNSKHSRESESFTLVVLSSKVLTRIMTSDPRNNVLASSTGV